MPLAVADQSEWVDAKQAAAILGAPDARLINRLARAGMVTTRNIPTVRARFLREDLELLARVCVTPGTVVKRVVAPAPTPLTS